MLRRFVVLLIVSSAFACADTRLRRSSDELVAARKADDARIVSDTYAVLERAIACVKKQHDEWVAGRRATPATFDILAISGGGDWGAFGAGFLRGWSDRSGPLPRPEFTIVTGVSTGALIAPFAFLGDDVSLAQIDHLYRSPRPDWVVRRLPLWFLPYHASFATVPGLEREVRRCMNLERMGRIVEAGHEGRVLIMNTTNADDGSMHIWDMVAEAEAAVGTGRLDRVHDIMLASSGIPGAFPHRMIDGSMHVDGGVIGNVLYGGRLREKQTHVALWKATYPEIPVPKTRYWVIFNNQMRGPPHLIEPTWPAIVARSIDLAIRAATLTSIRHLFAQAEITRLRYDVEVEVRVVAVPGDWKAPREGTFIKETMNNLADLGERMGGDPASWSCEPPP